MTREHGGDDLVDRSSLGEPAARELQRRVAADKAAEAVRRAGLSAVPAPQVDETLLRHAMEVLEETEAGYDHELLHATETAQRILLSRVREALRRARDAVHDRPGAALALTMSALQDLERLADARARSRADTDT